MMYKFLFNHKRTVYVYRGSNTRKVGQETFANLLNYIIQREKYLIGCSTDKLQMQ